LNYLLIHIVHDIRYASNFVHVGFTSNVDSGSLRG